MGNKGMITGSIGQVLDEKLKCKLDDAVTLAIEEYNITDFYFVNHVDEDIEDNETMRGFAQEMMDINRYIANQIRDHASLHHLRDIRTALVVARPCDQYANIEMFDEVIQGYPLYFAQLEHENASDAFQLRDDVLATSVDAIFWYSNQILVGKSPLAAYARACGKQIVYV